MKKWIIFWICILAACTPVSEPEQPVIVPEPVAEPIVPVTRPVTTQVEPATRTVKQTGKLGTVVYGLTEDERVVRVEKTGAVWEYTYQKGKLVEISGPQEVDFFYEKGKLSAIDLGATKLRFEYDVAGRLVDVTGGKENLHMEYDSLNLLRSVKRGVAGETNIDYDKQGMIKYLTRGLVTTDLFYDDKQRVRNFDADDTKFILGYWRDDKLISLSGKTFGPGLTLSYGPDHPPFEATLIYSEDDSKFTSAYTDTLYEVVDDYIYCKYVRRLKEVLFEGISYAFYVNYFGGDIAGYLAMQFVCLPYEA
jgi:hypothetical protein